MKTKLFALGLCAMVAFASCSKDDDAPAIRGAVQLSENFDLGTTGDLATKYSGWSILKVKGTVDWKVKDFNKNKFLEATAFNAPAGEYETWLVSPALNVTGAKVKTVSFDAAMGYWAGNTTLEVYVMTDSLNTKGDAVKIDAKTPTSDLVQWGWYNSGILDLSKFSGKIYIGFKFKATSTDPTKVTTFRIENFKFGVEPVKGDLATNPLSVDEVIATQDNSIKWVKGYVIGFAVSGSSATTIKTTNFATGDVTNLVLAPTADVTDIKKCIVVKLLAGKPRTDLGLGVVANQTILKKEVSVRGILGASFGQPGMTDVADFVKP